MSYESNIDTYVIIDKMASWNEWEIENVINMNVGGLYVAEKVTAYSENIATIQA
jgi:hypothetical protein